MEFTRVAIIGRGLIGGSIELALQERCPGIASMALDRGDDLAAVSGAELVILSAPIGVNNRVLLELRSFLGPHTLITDTGSTKTSTVAAAEGLRFIGGHPVAGAAQGGLRSARADLFEGRPWILTPPPGADGNDLARLQRLIERLGAHLALLDAAEHDRLFGYLSHLPQLTASALMEVVGARAGIESLRLAGAGLRDSTRLASSRPEIWLDILETNRTNITEALDALIAALTALRNDASGNALTEVFERASLFRTHLQERQK